MISYIRFSVFLLSFFFLTSSCSNVPPHPCFTVSATEMKAGDTIRFKNCSEHAYSYEWDFGDGRASNALHVPHAFRVAGTYTVTLKAFEENGEWRNAHKVIHVQ